LIKAHPELEILKLCIKEKKYKLHKIRNCVEEYTGEEIKIKAWMK